MRGRLLNGARRYVVAACLLCTIVLASCSNGAKVASPDWGLLNDFADAQVARVEDAIARLPTLPVGFSEGWSATATGQPINVHAAPDGASQVLHTFEPINAFGFDPTTFQIVSEARDELGAVWYLVELPPVVLVGLPNGSQGWISGALVSVQGHTNQLVIDLSDRTLTRLNNGAYVEHWTVGIGKDSAETPIGNFFIWTKWLPEQGSHPAYGSGVLAINAISEDLDSWQGGSPLIAMHGWDQTSDIGSNVSDGCVQMTNERLVSLLGSVPLGTPVSVVA